MAETETAPAPVLIDWGVYRGIAQQGPTTRRSSTVGRASASGDRISLYDNQYFERGIRGIDVGESRTPARPSRGG